jgi:hypothetical protein
MSLFVPSVSTSIMRAALCFLFKRMPRKTLEKTDGDSAREDGCVQDARIGSSAHNSILAAPFVTLGFGFAYSAYGGADVFTG